MPHGKSELNEKFFRGFLTVPAAEWRLTRRFNGTETMASPRYGDNIFDLIAIVSLTLKGAGWQRDKIDAELAKIRRTKTYDDAVEACRKFITIRKAA